jgi:hypothetical protein
MSLKGQTVRIIIHEPLNWDKGNLFGSILSDRNGDKLVIKLTNPIKGDLIMSDTIEFRPISEKDTFKPLTQYYSVMVKGTLIKDNLIDKDFFIIGSVTID